MVPVAGRYLRAILAVRRGNADEAIALMRESLTRIGELRDKFAFVYALVPLAAAAVLKGDDAWAARILGARDAVTERTGATVVDNSVRRPPRTGRTRRARTPRPGSVGPGVCGGTHDLHRCVAERHRSGRAKGLNRSAGRGRVVTKGWTGRPDPLILVHKVLVSGCRIKASLRKLTSYRSIRIQCGVDVEVVPRTVAENRRRPVCRHVDAVPGNRAAPVGDRQLS